MKKSIRLGIVSLLAVASLVTKSNAQTLNSATGNGLLTESSKVYNVTWYSNSNTPFEKTVTISYSNLGSGDKVTVTGTSTDTALNQVKSNITGSTSFLDVTRWPRLGSLNTRNL